MKIMKDTEGRERLKREGIRLIQDRTRRQTETLRTLRAQGKVGYYRGRQLQVKDRESVPSGQFEPQQRWHNREHQVGSGRVMGEGSQGGHYGWSGRGVDREMDGARGWSGVGQTGRRGEMGMMGEWRRGGGQGSAWTRGVGFGWRVRTGGEMGVREGRSREGRMGARERGRELGGRGMEERSGCERRNDGREENVGARGMRRREEIHRYGGGASASERQKYEDTADSGSEHENVREYDWRAKEKGVQEEEGVEDRQSEYDGKNSEEKEEKDGVDEGNEMCAGASVMMSEGESLPQSIWEIIEQKKSKETQRAEGETSVQSIVIDRAHSQEDLDGYIGLEPVASSQCESEGTSEQPSIDEVPYSHQVAVTHIGESEGAVLIEGVQDSCHDTTSHTQGTHSNRETVRGNGDMGGREGGRREEDEGASQSDETHTKPNMRQTSLKEHTHSSRKTEEEREREGRMRDVTEGKRTQTSKKPALRSNANNAITPNRQSKNTHSNTQKKDKKGTK